MPRALVALPLLLSLAALPAAADEASPGPLIVGEEIFDVYETAHPYSGVAGASPTMVHSFEVSWPGASYIAPHFARFELAPGDFVVVRSDDGSRSWTYERFGKGDLGRGEGFWGIHVAGDTAVVELHSRHAASGAFGFTIDRFARGFTAAELGLPALPGTAGPESLCGADDSDEAKCWDPSPEYDSGRAVARLLIQGFSLCTGWLVGDDGHLVTNNHCIGTSSAAMNTDYEFMAEGDTCATNCSFQLACPGVIEATSATFIQTDFSLDYTLVKLPTDITPTYGFLQLRDTPAVLGEQIYSGQHPGGWGKRLAVFSTHADNPGGFAEVDSVSEPSCQGGGPPEVGYYMDTQGGSSGSPVLGSSDHCVVALHHCRGNFACTSGGGDPNRGVPIPEIISDMGGNLPPNALCPTEPPAMTLSPPDPGQAGTLNCYDVGGATPNGTVRLILGLNSGSLIPPGCSTPIGIADPHPLDSQTADGSGNATVCADIPGGASGATLLAQAVDTDAAGCAVSNVDTSVY